MGDQTPRAQEPQSMDWDSYVDQAALLLDLPIAPEYRANVAANLERVAGIAQLVLAFPLPPEIEVAPVFEP